MPSRARSTAPQRWWRSDGVALSYAPDPCRANGLDVFIQALAAPPDLFILDINRPVLAAPPTGIRPSAPEDRIQPDR